MKKFLLPFTLILLACESSVKNQNAEVNIEPGTDTSGIEAIQEMPQEPEQKYTTEEQLLLGYWVGWFERDDDDERKAVIADEFYWGRQNKINISIDRIENDSVFGHSVVAGNHRPFEGAIRKKQHYIYECNVKEPGDDKYDGAFNFTVIVGKNTDKQLGDSPRTLTGTWKAFKKINIQKRKYQLQPANYAYNADQMLKQNKRYIDWSKKKSNVELWDIDEGEFEEWVHEEFSSATDKIYKINASNTLLTKAYVENLKQGDLVVIRNTIYARHGYSFKNRPLRIFFDAQSWYIPVKADIKSEFSDIEKKNIQLLLKYEKNAKQYYDYFGRG
jgi:hypothetical protein